MGVARYSKWGKWGKYLLLSIFIIVCQEVYSDNFVTHVTITTYNPVKEQCDDDPFTTADGTKIDVQKLKQQKIKYCAVSRNLLWIFPYGTKLYIEGWGIYEVRDTMNPRYKHCIDILQHSSKKNVKQEKVKIIKL